MKKDSTNLMILFLSFSNIIGNVLTIVSGLLVARWLLPEELGFYSGFTLIPGYIILAQVGIPSGLSREYPLFIGKGERKKALSFASVAQLWQLVLGGLVLVPCICLSIYFVFVHKLDYAAGTLVVGILSFQGLYVTKYLKVLYRTNLDFNKLSIIGLIVAFVSFASIVFVWQFDFYGLCIRAVVIFLTDFYFTWRWRPIDVKPRWNPEAFRELFKIGFPMYCIANLYGLWPLLQRTLILSLGGTRYLGLFAVAVMIDNAMKTVSGAIANVTYPKMVAEWGRGATIPSIMRINIKPLALAAILFAVAVPVGWMLLPSVIDLVLPNYAEGLAAAQWMLLAGFLGIFTVLGNIYNVIQKQRDRFVYFVCGILSWFCAVYFFYFSSGFTLEMFPKSMCIALVIMLMINVLHIIKYNKSKHLFEQK